MQLLGTLTHDYVTAMHTITHECVFITIRDLLNGFYKCHDMTISVHNDNNFITLKLKLYMSRLVIDT